MNKKQQNINTYNKSAKKLAAKFDSFKGYPKEIKKVFSFFPKNNPKTLEIGCGSGRDAKEIIKYTNNYLGIDISRELIRHAKNKSIKANFLVTDVEKFSFPKKIDIIFAFASLLHSDDKNLKKIFKKIYHSLNNNGIFFLSLKHGRYHEELVNDKFGKRFFYFYNLKKLKEIAGKDFKIIWKEIENFQNQKWVSVIFQKSN